MAKIKGLKQAIKGLKRVDDEIDSLIKKTLLKYGKLILEKALADLPLEAREIRSSAGIELSDEGYRVVMYFDNVLAAYIEFGTGDYAREYLATQPTIIQEEAMNFFVTGKGTLPASPFFFKHFYAYKDQMIAELKQNMNVIAVRFNAQS